MKKLDLTGKDTANIIFQSNGVAIHSDVIEPYNALQTAAFDAGFDMQIASGFRDFERQLKIWNGKYLGMIPIFDDNQIQLDVDTLEPFERIKAILRFSALPGASRHHWGTDFDYYDKSTFDQTLGLKLVSSEYQGDGPFANLHQWLLKNAENFGFHFPYLNHNGGIAEEPWHMSYYPLSSGYLELLESEPKILFDLIINEDIAGKTTILRNFEHILDYYILNVNRVE
ncbi:M15 family metallopeptidase [Psychrosphaera sp. B3R10]|uniref:M15 family metallopeptidase n=1 Tax=unclassified Psychrosphaera TaxID=2641570 RepID=UPI001C0A52D8|nr:MULTISPECIES: M15 family metallopeptidase [unclassified Psychrosphaera]MBU2882215.1 M15 family metallopeptidase [Psychrosphaera sp. I2R16]MBU2988896.1 M15 family metallopeptidase [Psychrosphaera sp. B3R10]MDO6717916.1 M15 family metallopeptidase [Psychrosphaera sp. 1_MG-2023]